MSDVHSHHDPHAAPDAHEIEHIQSHLKVYFMVFGALAFLTVVTVAVSYVDLGVTGNVVLALVIATFKACLVALFFMHLSSEKKIIYTFLAFTGFFCLALFALFIFAHSDPIHF